jgi:acetylornithine deacetylase/succinyl-diaminopimelate desuccinylase-like protein
MPDPDKLTPYLKDQQERALSELQELLRIPSISSDPANAADVKRCAEALAARLREAGLEHVQVLPTKGHPVVYGDWLHATGKPTVLVYGHYDVQPVDPLDEWTTPPFEPAVRDGQLYARGSADDKGQVYVHVKALEALLQTRHALPVNIRVLFEGEEEIGSPNLDAFIVGHRDLLRADVAVVSDTSMYERDMPSICYGLRGLAYFQVDLQGPNRDLHSGTYGGVVVNPTEALARMLATLKGPDGRIAVDGFYDDVTALSAHEREELGRLPFDEAHYKRELGVEALWGEVGYGHLERNWARPTLDINGIWGGFSGPGSKTIIPATAGVKISCRLVPDQRPERIAELVEKHLRQALPKGVRMKFTVHSGGRPSITPLDHWAARAAGRALERAFGKKPVFIRAGGTIPVVASFDSILGVPTVLVGFGVPDERAHAPNEFFLLSNFYRGIAAIAYLWEELAAGAASTQAVAAKQQP